MINYSIAIMGTKPGTKKSQITETKAYGIAQCSEIIDINDFAKHIRGTAVSMARATSSDCSQLP